VDALVILWYDISLPCALSENKRTTPKVHYTKCNAACAETCFHIYHENVNLAKNSAELIFLSNITFYMTTGIYPCVWNTGLFTCKMIVLIWQFLFSFTRMSCHIPKDMHISSLLYVTAAGFKYQKNKFSWQTCFNHLKIPMIKCYILQQESIID